MNFTKIPAIAQRLRALHLFSLCAFAVTQPLLSALSRQTVYLHDQNFGGLEIGSLLAILMLLLPLGVVAIDWILLRLSRKIHGWGRNTAFVVLSSIFLLSLLRPYDSIDWMLMQGSAGLLSLAVAILCAWFLTWLYERQQWLRSWMTLTSVGLVIFPGMFLWQLQRIQGEVTSIDGRVIAKNPVPVVLIVFDEFSGTTLLDERMEIDAQLFPQFARLAELSTWYRNATTVSPRTDIAVPAILSGRFPVTPLPPLAPEYPGNLFQMIEATKTFDMAVFEPISRLCSIPNLRRPEPPRSSAQKSADLVQTLAAVYPRLIFTSDTPMWFPTIPRAWFGLPEASVSGGEEFERMTTGRFNYAGSEHRQRQLQHFLRCLRPSDRPAFCFMHAILPHYPWSFLPSGDQYQSEFAAPYSPSGARGELGEDWDDDPATVARNEYRYRLQVGYVDLFIGQLLDRLEKTNLLDRCLLIVTADHGVAFRPGHSRRLPDADNLPDILSVPLFIKLPGQSGGRTDDRNVESIDLLPTIAEVLDLELPEPVDGIPVSREIRRTRKSLYFEKTMTVVEPDLPQRLSSVRRQLALFESGGLDRPSPQAASHSEWHGRSISTFDIDERTIPVDLFDHHNRNAEQEFSFETVLVPCLISGSFVLDDLPKVPAEIVLVVDGIVRDTGRTYAIHGREHGFQFLIPDRAQEGKAGPVELYAVDSKQTRLQLKRLADRSQTQ